MNWKDITLYKFQQIDAVNAKPIDDMDKILYSTCIVFNMTEYQLDNADPKKALKLTSKVAKIFEAPFNPKPFKRIGKYFINYDVSKVTLGQYIELSFFLATNQIQNAHYTLASVTNRKYDHRKKADYFLHKPITKIMGSISLIIERFSAFNKEYNDLFGLDKEVSGEVHTNPFNKRYGWIYSASQIAEYERISLEETFKIPIRQAFNDLAYLKAKSKYEAEQLKQK